MKTERRSSTHMEKLKETPYLTKFCFVAFNIQKERLRTRQPQSKHHRSPQVIMTTGKAKHRNKQSNPHFSLSLTKRKKRNKSSERSICDDLIKD